MPTYTPISREQHQHAGYAPREGFQFAQSDAVVPVVLEELPQIITTMVLAFIEGDQEGSYELVALQALQPNSNHYVHSSGRWIGSYVPAYYRGYPFRLVPVEGNNRMVLCIDTDSGLFHQEAEADDFRFFGPDGEPTTRLQQLMTFHEKLEKNRHNTQQAVSKLAEAGVIAPWNIEVKGSDDNESRQVEGLYHIDESRLRNLGPKALTDLVRTGVMSLAYTQLFSEHRLRELKKLYDLQNELASKKRKPEIDLEALFSDDDDENLKF